MVQVGGALCETGFMGEPRPARAQTRPQEGRAPATRWHDLRHTFASLLIAGGANITFVSRQLGHSSSQITLSVYAHLLDREEQAERTRQMLQDTLGSVV